MGESDWSPAFGRFPTFSKNQASCLNKDSEIFSAVCNSSSSIPLKTIKNTSSVDINDHWLRQTQRLVSLIFFLLLDVTQECSGYMNLTWWTVEEG